MKKDVLIDALSGIDEAIINEVASVWAQDMPKRKAKLLSPRTMKILGAAACVCLAFTIGFSIISLMFGESKNADFGNIMGENDME